MNSDVQAINEILKEVENSIPKVKWVSRSAPDDPSNPVYYMGDAPNGWKFLVASFDIADQGFPPGSRGHDGTASAKGTIMRLTPELAQQAFQTAEASYKPTP